MLDQNTHIILFDGVCNLCSGVVQFVIKHDRRNLFKFASLQSDSAQKLLLHYKVPFATNSFILIEKGKVYSQSTAALKVVSKLSGAWSLLATFIIIPPPIRDSIYNIIATNRYNWFGKKNECWLPTPSMQNKFI